ncbi:MAG: chemotaxis protein CheD [Pseudomonadota bacterium]
MTQMVAYAQRPARAPTLIGVGGVAWSGDPAVVYSTLLGSCIAVCMWDPTIGKGGINHFLLATGPTPRGTDTRYGEISLPLLRQNLCAVGCNKSNMRAIVAGGADLLSSMRPIGTENTDYAVAWLRSEGIQIVQKDVGGTNARRVRFLPSTGQCQITQVEAPPVSS